MRPSSEIDTLRQQLPYHRLRQVRKGKVLPIDWPTEWERFDANELFAFDMATIPPKLLENMRKRQDVLMDGNQAAISVLTRLIDGLCGYPITPSTPIAETFARVAANGQKNLFGNELMYFQPSDELSAIAAVEAMACQGGRYADNTSSQGLLLKTKNLFSVAGKRLPVVMTVMAREVNKGSLSIHCGHTDFYAVRNAGWAQLMSEDNQELHDLLPVAFKVSELKQVMLPTMVIGDGFIKSHAIENIKELSDAFLEYYVGPPNRMYQPNFEHGTLTGTFTDTDLTMEGQVAQDLAYRFFKRGFVIAMNNMNKILGTNLKVVDCYRTEDADMVVVILGSAAGVVKDVVDYYRDVKGYKIGVVRPVLFNPPCYEELAYGMRKAKVISVLERAGTAHNQLLLADVQASLQISIRAGREGKKEHRIYGREDMPTLFHGVYGLGSKDFNKYDAAAVVENMLSLYEKKRRFQRDFYVGIEGPMTLRSTPLPGYLERELGMTFIGVGAEGVKTALESAALVYAQDIGTGKKYVQSGARYGAARKGAPVFMNLRISSQPIRNSSELTERDVLAFFNEKFLSDQILKEYVGGLKENGLLVINSSKSCYDIMATFSPQVQSLIKYRQIKLITIDGTRAALQHLNRNLPGAAFLGLINREMGILPEKEFEQRFKKTLEKILGTKKREMLESNISLLKYGAEQASGHVSDKAPGALALDATTPVYTPPLPENFGQGRGTAGLPVVLSDKDQMGIIRPVNLTENYQEVFYQNMIKPILDGKKVPWDHFLPIVPAGTSRYRDVSYIGAQLPVYDAAKCIACGICAASCPDSALISTVTDRPVDEAARYFKKFKNPPKGIPWERFALNINADPAACKGCGVCAQVCPTDALKMADKAAVKEEDFLPEDCRAWDNTVNLAPYVDKLSLNHQVLFVYSKLYPGKHTLCPGCSEGVINLLTFYAAESLRNNPQGIATFYQGLKILSEKNKRAIEHMLDYGFNIYSINATGCDQVSELVNPFNTRMYPSGHYGFGTASAAALGAKFSLDQAYQNRYNSVLTKIIVFAGDGAIYDIGNGPFNHALGENFDITWVIFNNEGYMNTGMQKSGATRFGTDRSTSPIGRKLAGKTTLHRRIISQAMAISHVYAAKLTIDNPFYAIKILKEAIAYNGPSMVEFFSACPTGHVTSDWAGPMISRMMVESRKWQVAVRRPFQRIDISGNPAPDLIYPKEGKSFKRGIKRDAATFYDVVSMLGQYNQHIKTVKSGDIPEIVRINETVSLFRWLRNQYMAGYRDNMPSEEEVEKIVEERYRL
ncbi:MAG: 2-oxoacid:acceptor oxidoreductase family protein [Proteobacteria bacterium]|nr:2-oxoacid:acceptor oxidoreductase family protein [Pseudomonadota bacterium]MBU4448559.1 2-oxoacid:acceptor oxidoreductase family protein [Pseudomonadota bacterium]